jgi:hypothetical protein
VTRRRHGERCCEACHFQWWGSSTRKYSLCRPKGSLHSSLMHLMRLGTCWGRFVMHPYEINVALFCEQSNFDLLFHWHLESQIFRQDRATSLGCDMLVCVSSHPKWCEESLTYSTSYANLSIYVKKVYSVSWKPIFGASQQIRYLLSDKKIVYFLCWLL